MSNILVLCSGYFGKATANGLCAREIVNAIEKQGHGVAVISVGETDITCHSLNGKENRIAYKKSKRLSEPKNIAVKAWRLGNLFLHAWSPKHNRDIVRKMTALAQNECRENQIDAIVCVYFPLEAALSGYRIKKEIPDVKYIIYELDSVADGIAGGGKWHKPIVHAYKCVMGKAYKEADRVIIMKSHEAHWSVEHAPYVNKMCASDLPVLVPATLSSKKKRGEEIKLLYSGALSEGFRSPTKLIDVFKLLDGVDLTLDFYSKGCEALLDAAKTNDGRISCHGYVEKTVLDEAIADADVLVSIGNAISNSVPSKVITYMTYGKPIIHFSLQENDVCTEYLEKYPLALVVGWNESPESAAERVREFTRGAIGQSVDFASVCEGLPMNVPSHSARLIEEVVEK